MAPKQHQRNQKHSTPVPQPQPTPAAIVNRQYVWTNYNAHNMLFDQDGKAHIDGKMTTEAHRQIATKHAQPGDIPFARTAAITRPEAFNLFDVYMPSLGRAGYSNAAMAMSPKVPAKESAKPRMTKAQIESAIEPPPPQPQSWSVTAKELGLEIQRGRALTHGRREPILGEKFFGQIAPIMDLSDSTGPYAQSRPQYGLPQAVPWNPAYSSLFAVPGPVPSTPSGRTFQGIVALNSPVDTCRPLVDNAFA